MGWVVTEGGVMEWRWRRNACVMMRFEEECIGEVTEATIVVDGEWKEEDVVSIACMGEDFGGGCRGVACVEFLLDAFMMGRDDSVWRGLGPGMGSKGQVGWWGGWDGDVDGDSGAFGYCGCGQSEGNIGGAFYGMFRNEMGGFDGYVMWVGDEA